MFSMFKGATETHQPDPFHAEEGFRPTRVLPTVEMAFAHWTERASVQSEFVAARELAGLPEANLAALAAEFEKSPRRKRTDPMRFGYSVAIAMLLAAGAFGLAHFAYPNKSEGLDALEVMTAVCLTFAAIAMGVGSIGALKFVPLDSAYGKVGLYVAILDEQHPWLYKTLSLMSYKKANDYREEVLRERGLLRGIDYLMMREIATAHEGVMLTQTAHSVVRAVQGTPVRAVPEAPAPEASGSREVTVVTPLETARYGQRVGYASVATPEQASS